MDITVIARHIQSFFAAIFLLRQIAVPFFDAGANGKIIITSGHRTGLVKPGKKDEWTNYRYYTEADIVRLNTVRALQLMDLPLQEIKKVLEYDDLEKIVDFLSQAEKKADAKIKALQYSKTKIRLAKADYERKLQMHQTPKGTSLSASVIRI